MSKQTIIVVIISLVAGGIISIVVVLLLWRYKSKRGNSFKNNNKFLFATTDIETVQLNLESNGGGRRFKFNSNRLSSCHTEKEYFTEPVPVDPEWEVDYENIEFKGMLGEGAFGRVMMAIVHGLPSNPGEPTVSAVKMLKGLFCLFCFYLQETPNQILTGNPKPNSRAVLYLKLFIERGWRRKS